MESNFLKLTVFLLILLVNLSVKAQDAGATWQQTKLKNGQNIYMNIDAEFSNEKLKKITRELLLDQLYNDTYLTEQRMDNILEIFATLTIFVACLGLFGLVTFTAEQRVKEIGIRKVLGASVTQIVSMLSKDLLILVMFSFLIAFPLGFYLMNKWLQDFAYRTDIHWWVFVLAAVAVVLVAFLTMSVKTVKSALSNPVDSLRSE